MGAAEFARFAAASSATLALGCCAIWGGFVLWFHAPGGRAGRWLCVFVWAAISTAALAGLWQGWAAAGALMFALAFCALLIGWRRISPSNDRLWADEVAQMTTGSVDGNRVTLHNVRNFDWRTNTDYTPRWETRRYDLDRMQSVDMIVSYWTIRPIAHMLISFGFEGGEHVVFSVEVRRQRQQSFSEIGGFFKEFELSIVAADERDAVRVRSNVRGEDVYLYRIRMPVPAIRSLFLGYLDQANALVTTPRFYNTITVNCTTLVYHMMQRIVGYLPLNYRLLLSGYLPEYVYRVGGLDHGFALEELRARGRITERARQSDRSDSFSADIREGIPVFERQG
ncbi:MAG: DUF4105 domain-containing protein [Steroidobacteraceae bacterium]